MALFRILSQLVEDYLVSGGGSVIYDQRRLVGSFMDDLKKSEEFIIIYQASAKFRGEENIETFTRPLYVRHITIDVSNHRDQCVNDRCAEIMKLPAAHSPIALPAIAS